jgi:hypothetical protein
VRLADLKVIQAAAADQGVVAGPNRKMSGLALLGGLGVEGEPFVSRSLRCLMSAGLSEGRILDK